MKKRLLALELIVMLVALSACQSAAQVESPASITRQVSTNAQFIKAIPNTGRLSANQNEDLRAVLRAVSSEPQLSFASPRYSYRMAYPKGWQLIQRPGFWEADQALYPGNPGTDTYISADGSQSLVVGRRELPAGATLESYVQAGLRQVSEQFFTCGDPESSQAVSVGNSIGEQFSYHCSDGYYLLLVFAVRGQAGLTAAWQSPAGHEMVDQARFQRMIASLAFE